MKGHKLKAKILNTPKSLTPAQIYSMYQIYETYYGSVDLETFTNDLNGKNKVILLIDKKDHTIRGFSTILNYHFNVKGKSVKGIFSGDTIIEKEYWGGSALQKAFIKNMLTEKLKRPFSPLYWFLISKGYRTYLLMTNNFSEHYPRYEEETPEEKKEIMDRFAKELYPENYDGQTGLIKFNGIHDHLREDVAPIDQKMIKESPRIRFFSEKNPTWKWGTELVCLARFDITLPIRHAVKCVKKQLPHKPLVPARITARVDSVDAEQKTATVYSLERRRQEAHRTTSYPRAS